MPLTEVPASGAHNYWALALAERGEFDEGIAHGQEAIRLAEVADHPFSLVLACWGLAHLYSLRGELNHAVRLLERGLALSRESNLTVLSPRVRGSVGSVYARLERIPEGLSLLHQALKSMEALGIGGYHSLLVAHVGEVYLLDGRLEEALACGGRALALTRQRGERGFEAWALRLLAEVASYRDPPDIQTTEDHYRRAMALADELGMRPLGAHCHLGLGKLYRRTADRATAREHMTIAATMYRTMDMRFWLEQAEGED